MSEPANIRVLRSMLFAPANRRELVPKLARSGADAAILDLEDGVAPSGKDDARAVILAGVSTLVGDVPTPPFFVRVNPPGSVWFEEDLDVAVRDGIAGVVLPKIEDQAPIDQVRALAQERGLEHFDVLAGIETAAGVANVERIFAARPEICYFGAEDYTADMGGERSPLGLEVLYARSRVVLAARMSNVTAMDQVVVEFRDDEKFIEDAALGRSLGYHGKICINPRQVPLANACFSPSAADVDRSRQLLELYRQAGEQGLGVIEFEGSMVDEPLVQRARRVAAIAEAIAARR